MRFRVPTLQDTSGKARRKLIVRCAVPQSHGFFPHPGVTPRHVAFQVADAVPGEGALRRVGSGDPGGGSGRL